DLIRESGGLDFLAALETVEAWAGLDSGAGHCVQKVRPAELTARRLEQEAREQQDLDRRIEEARAIWRGSVPADGTLVVTYLRARGITTRPPASLRFHGALPYQKGMLLPCMVAAVQAPDRKITAVHRTFLRLDGRGKAGVSTPKKALGPIGRGAVRLAPAAEMLGIAEGIETGLSAMEITGIPVWCALGSAIHRLDLPPQVRQVVI